MTLDDCHDDELSNDIRINGAASSTSASWPIPNSRSPDPRCPTPETTMVRVGVSFRPRRLSVSSCARWRSSSWINFCILSDSLPQVISDMFSPTLSPQPAKTRRDGTGYNTGKWQDRTGRAGGLGTLEEFCEVLTWSRLGFHTKPCALLNVEKYFDPLLALFDHAVSEGFVKSAHRTLGPVDGRVRRWYRERGPSA